MLFTVGRKKERKKGTVVDSAIDDIIMLDQNQKCAYHNSGSPVSMHPFPFLAIALQLFDVVRWVMMSKADINYLMTEQRGLPGVQGICGR